MSVGPNDVKFIREVFGLSQRDLAKAMNVAPNTVSRWENGDNDPAGLQGEVLQALHNTAVHVRDNNDDHTAKVVGGLIALGIGALIFYLLTQSNSGA